MKKVLTISFAIILILLLLASCNENGNNNVLSTANIETDISLKAAEISDLLQSGIGIVELEAALGVSPKEIFEAYDSRPAFRFDLITVAGYENPILHDGNIDTEGLRDGRVRIVVHVTYNDENVMIRHSIFYSPTENRLYHIRDGVRTDASDMLENLNGNIPEYPHPFAVALTYFLEVIPDTPSPLEDAIISHASAWLIDLDGNGTMGVLAYKALGKFDHFALFYMHENELVTSGMYYATEFWRLSERGESPFAGLFGGEGAGRNYSVFSLTENGLTETSALWATVHGEFLYNDNLVTEDEFNALLEQYNLNDERWLVLDLKPHIINGVVARPEAINPRVDDTAAILAMTMPAK